MNASNRTPTGGEPVRVDAADVWRDVRARLRGFIATRVADETAVEDLLQEVFLRLHRKLDRLRDPDRLTPWIFQITRRVIVDHYRASGRRREVPAGLAGDLDITHPRATPVQASEEAGRFRTELARCLAPMVARLSKEYREAVTLTELEGLTQQAAAMQLGLSVSGMKSRVQRGRRQLKRMLQDCCVIQLDRRRSVTAYAVRSSGCNPCEPVDGPLIASVERGRSRRD